MTGGPRAPTLRLRTRRESRHLAARLARALAPSDLVLLDGDLGSGKTFLVRAMARALGITDRVTSPTFTLVNEYRCALGVLVHVDLYRLRGEPGKAARDAEELGLRAMRADGAVLVVEWGDDVVETLGGAPAFAVRLAIAGEHERVAAIGGERASDIV